MIAFPDSVSLVIAHDPGKNPGYAWGTPDGVLIGAEDRHPNVEFAFARNSVAYVVELPQVYRVSKGDPNDLIFLAFNAGRVVGNALNVFTVLPRKWKGNIKKEVMTERIKRALPEDRHSSVILPARKSLAHNVWDAVGLFLWATGKLSAKRVIAR